MEPLKDKLIKERNELEGKIKRLHEFRTSEWCKENVPVDHINLLNRQEMLMILYSETLEQRIQML
jgi:hypothetical protein